MKKGIDIEKFTLVVLIVAVLLIAFNTVQISQLKTTGATVSTRSTATSNGFAVIPTGIPAVYGQELGISFDDVSPQNPQKADSTIRKLAALDQRINLEGDDLERYFTIGSQISCEYCCGAQAIIFSNGQAACACAHSFALRGLAKHLIQNHGDEFSNNEILEELGKWKTLFFPRQITEKAKILEENGIELNYINLASNKYRGIEQGVSGSMVGGC